jgi:hypothetical protein
LDVTAKKPVGGCARGNYFLPAKALVAGHTYRGSTVYAAAEGGATRPFAWTFTAGATSCISIKAVRSTTVKRLRRGLTLRFSTCQAGRAKVQIIAGKSTVKGRATVPARAARFVTVTVKARVGRGTVLVPCDDAWRHRQRAHPRALKPVPAATT